MTGNRHKLSGRRAFFSTDIGTAMLLAMLIASIGMLSLKTTVHSLAWETSLGLSESNALRLADFLLKQCDFPALSECDSDFAYSHVISRNKAEALKTGEEALKKILGTGKNVSARIIDLDGRELASTGRPATAACITRIALMDGGEVFLEACSG